MRLSRAVIGQGVISKEEARTLATPAGTILGYQVYRRR
jgi:hypothetical protein